MAQHPTKNTSVCGAEPSTLSLLAGSACWGVVLFAQAHSKIFGFRGPISASGAARGLGPEDKAPINLVDSL